MRCGAVIAAAGMSTRMKQFKQLMKMGNISIAERVIVSFRNAGVDDIVMVTDHNADKLEKALRHFGIEFVRNEQHAAMQMFDSAKPGLAYLEGRCDKVFFCPVNLPFFTDQTISQEISAMSRNPNVKVVVPVCRGKEGHPLLIQSDAIAKILAYNGRSGMKGAYEDLPEESVLKIDVHDEGVIIDAGTREEYQRLVNLHNERILHPEIKVMLASTSAFFGPGTVELLRQIDQCGNVRDACEKCGFSYSKGWVIIRRCEEKFGHSIVERQPGGQAGGSAKVTEKGYHLLAVYEELERDLSALAVKKFRELMNKYQLAGERSPMAT